MINSRRGSHLSVGRASYDIEGRQFRRPTAAPPVSLSGSSRTLAGVADFTLRFAGIAEVSAGAADNQ